MEVANPKKRIRKKSIYTYAPTLSSPNQCELDKGLTRFNDLELCDVDSKQRMTQRFRHNQDILCVLHLQDVDANQRSF